MKQNKESYIRLWLAKHSATKLLIKSISDLSKLEFKQFYNSITGYYYTLKCSFFRFFNNKKSVRCNLCSWSGNIFYPHVTTATVVHNEKCPKCHSIPRYRSLLKAIENNKNILTGNIKILEVGPNRSLQNILISNPQFDYTSIDLQSPQAMMHMDVTDLKFNNNCFDLIFCISVMQYVDNDEKGFSELYRVLKPNGKLIFASGIDETSETTINYPERNAANNFTTRMYGWDVKEKFDKAGFSINTQNSFEVTCEEDKLIYGLSSHTFFFLTK